MPCTVSRFHPFGFILCGHLKGQVFCGLPETSLELKTKIRQVIASITEETLQKV